MSSIHNPCLGAKQTHIQDKLLIVDVYIPSKQQSLPRTNTALLHTFHKQFAHIVNTSHPLPIISYKSGYHKMNMGLNYRLDCTSLSRPLDCNFVALEIVAIKFWLGVNRMMDEGK